MNPKILAVLLFVCAPCWAQIGAAAPAVAGSMAPADVTPATEAATPTVASGPAGTALRAGPLPTESAADRNEPNVRHSVIEDKGSKIDELVVRGQVQRVVVTPKIVTGKPYEIIVNRSGRETNEGTGGAESAVGKRVWSVLAF